MKRDKEGWLDKYINKEMSDTEKLIYESCEMDDDRLEKILSKIKEAQSKQKSEFIELLEGLDEKEITGCIARAWCHKKNEKKVMDIDLAKAILEEINKRLDGLKGKL